ncbi:MAG: hypothetical protein CMJ83_22795 [Planctomycetes bacterium]|nr:hypothetical protein [Planctomycetota bacterium]
MRFAPSHLLLLSLVFLAPLRGQDAFPAGIKRETLKAHLSFLASDDMKGRKTPSPELDAAADWLAARFAEGGLKPAFGDSFLQGKTIGDASKAKGVIGVGNDRFPLTTRHVAGSGLGGLSCDQAPVVLWTGGWRRTDERRAAAVSGAAVVLPGPDPRDHMGRFGRRVSRRCNMLAREGARAVLVATEKPLGKLPSTAIPVVWSDAAPLLGAIGKNQGRLADTHFTLTVPKAAKAYASNVGAILPGSDPKLASELIVFSAHYDHLGVDSSASGDGIFNGADDDASGTVAVVAIASALSRLKTHPKRTCLFLCFYGEEQGMHGSTYYVQNPAFPLRAHKAVFNLEMVGRPDDIPKNRAWVTGWSLSDFGTLIRDAAKPAGVVFYNHPQRSRMLFGSSDNISFARVGIPAFSISAGSLHEDYHRPSDHVAKIDFDNMTAVVRGIAVAGRAMADGGKTPTWSKENRAAGAYRAAREKLAK